jgi:hypothetical protein
MKRTRKYLLGLVILAGLAASSLAVAGTCANACLNGARDVYHQCLKDGGTKNACSAVGLQAYYDCLTATSCTP